MYFIRVHLKLTCASSKVYVAANMRRRGLNISINVTETRDMDQCDRRHRVRNLVEPTREREPVTMKISTSNSVMKIALSIVWMAVICISLSHAARCNRETPVADRSVFAVFFSTNLWICGRCCGVSFGGTTAVD